MSPAAPLALGLALIAAPVAAQDTTTITGKAYYLARIALPPDAEILVAVHEAAGEGPGAPLATAVTPTDGAQVPIPFEIEVPLRDVVSSSPYAVEVAIRQGVNVSWRSEPVTVALDEAPVDIGEVRLNPYKVLAFQTVFQCGNVTARFGMDGNQLALVVDGRTFQMAETRAASGARYEAAGDPETVFWSKGEEAMLTVAGEDHPTCRPLAEPVSGRTVLPGAPWVVETIGGEPVLADGPTATLEFTGEGGLSGRSSCNRYSAQYAVNGELLSVDPRIAVTQMACDPPILEQERDFLDALTSAQRWRVADGTLTINGDTTLTARRIGEAE